MEIQKLRNKEARGLEESSVWILMLLKMMTGLGLGMMMPRSDK